MLAFRCHSQDSVPKAKAKCWTCSCMYSNAPSPIFKWGCGNTLGRMCQKWQYFKGIFFVKTSTTVWGWFHEIFHISGCQQGSHVLQRSRVSTWSRSKNPTHHRRYGFNQSKKYFIFRQIDFSIKKITFFFLQMFVKALREMANPNGSSIQSVERHIRKVYSVEVDTGYMLEGKIQTKMIQSQYSV